MHTLLIVAAVIVIAFVVLYLLGTVIMLISISDDRNYFDWTIGYIRQSPNTDVGYQDVRMSFEKWKDLFELDPSQFRFLDTSDGSFIGLNDLDASFRKYHPTFQDKNGRYYVIDFKGREYSKYWHYEDALVARLSSIHEDKITRFILGDVQDKLDAIIQESRDQIDRSLKLQQEIVLRLEDDASKEGNHNEV